MELGSLPEWFTAFAEVTAVCVALFLPQYTAYRDRKASLARMRRVVSGMVTIFNNNDVATYFHNFIPRYLNYIFIAK